MSEITSFVCPASWKITTLGKICKETGGSIQTGPFGSQLHASDYVEDGIPSVMPKNISIEKILDDDIARVSVDDVNRLSKHKLQMGDIVYSRRGDVEKCVLVSEKEDGWLCGTGCIKVRIGPVGDISAKYIHAFLSHPEVRRWISQHAVGATMPNLNTSILSSVPVYLPPKELQSFIANSWFGFNQKLLVNAGINNTLENIAQAIFKSWFVDFEPTKAKIAAREALLAENPAATVEQIATAEQQAAIQAIAGAGDIIPTEQLQTIADLFPNQLVDSELDEIPEGWEVCISGELIDVRDGTHDSPKKAESGYPLVTSKHITSGVLKLEDTYLISEEDFEKVNKRSEVKTGDILLTMIGTVGIPYLVLDREVNFAIKNVGLFRTSKSKNHQFYFYLLLKTQMMQDYLEARMAGTTQKYLSLKVLRNLEFISPPLDSVLLSHFNLLITPIMNLIQQNSQQTYSLAELRDSLLPKLLFGEISFEDKGID